MVYMLLLLLLLLLQPPLVRTMIATTSYMHAGSRSLCARCG
jgi:hypothetical protein